MLKLPISCILYCGVFEKCLWYHEDVTVFLIYSANVKHILLNILLYDGSIDGSNVKICSSHDLSHSRPHYKIKENRIKFIAMYTT